MARAALREFTLTLREGDQISLWLRGAPRTRRACLYLSGSIVSWFRVADAFLTNRSRSPCARPRARAARYAKPTRIVAYNLAAPGARPGAYGSQMRGAWRTQGKRGTTRMLPPPPPSPPPSSQESSCRHSNSRTCSRRAEQPATSQQALTAAALRRHVCRPRRRALAALAAAAPAAALAAAVAVCNPKPSPRENPRCTQKILRKLKNSKPPFFQSHRISSHSHVSIID